MTQKANKAWAWIGTVVGILTIASYVWSAVDKIQSLSSRVSIIEASTTTLQDDIKYIRNRVDEIHDKQGRN